MATYTPSLRLTLPATGEFTNTWGTVANNGITSLTDAAIAGTVSIAMPDSDYTLTVANGSQDEARRMVLVLSGTLTAPRAVICPSASKLYVVVNAASHAITVKTSAGSGVAVSPGQTAIVRCDGTDVEPGVTEINGTPIPAATVLATVATAQTLENKEVVKRVVSAASGATLTPNVDTTDILVQANTELAGTLTVAAPTGTPVNGQAFLIRISSTAVQTFAWNSAYQGSVDVALPTVTSGGGKTDYIGFMYNSTAAKWQLLAKNFGF